MEWKTSIAKSDSEGTIIRGYPLTDLVQNKSFAETVFLLFKGELPTEKEGRMMDAILVSCIDHGIETPSVPTARFAASGGNSLNASVAAGVISMGDFHGGAIEKCAKMLSEAKDAKGLVVDAVENKKILRGFGHKLYKDADPRTQKIFEIAKENGLFGKYCEMALEIEKELEEQKGKKLVLNVDGAIAAIMLEMGFPWTLGKAFFIISRTAGICAHVHEELTEEKPFRRLKDSKYTGKPKRSL